MHTLKDFHLFNKLCLSINKILNSFLFIDERTVLISLSDVITAMVLPSTLSEYAVIGTSIFSLIDLVAFAAAVRLLASAILASVYKTSEGVTVFSFSDILFCLATTTGTITPDATIAATKIPINIFFVLLRF